MKRRTRPGRETPAALDPGAVARRARCAPISRHASSTGSGISNGWCGQLQRIAGFGDFLVAERRAMRLFRSLPVWRAKADHGAAGDQRRTIAMPRLLDRGSDRFGIMAVDPAGRPPRRLKARQLIVRTRQRGRSIDRDLVVVEQHDQAAEPEMPGQRNRFVAETLHQAAVAGDDISIVIDELVAEARVDQALRQRHADRGGDPLPERPRRGLDAGRMAVFGMARRLRSPLPECLELIQRHALIAGQVQQRIQQHRAVAGRQHEAVAIRPGRIGRIEFQEAREQHGGDVGHAHRHARMARFGFFNGVDGQKADRIGHFGVRNFRTADNGG